MLLCLHRCRVPTSGPEGSAVEGFTAAPILAEDWRLRRLWTGLLESPTAAEITLLQALGLGGSDEKPSFLAAVEPH